MTVSEQVQVATEVAEDLGLESYYNLNMKLVLMDLPAEELEVIKRFISQCKEGRK